MRPRFSAPASITLVLVALLSAGCVPPRQWVHDDPRDPIDQPTIVLMPVDIELFLVTTGGVLEPRVEWTESALLFSSALVKEIVSASSAQIHAYTEGSSSTRPRKASLTTSLLTISWTKFQFTRA